MNAEVEGFAQFVMARERALQRTAWLLTGDWALAEDLVQTALARGETDVAVGHEYDLLPRPLDPLFERRELLSDPVYLAVRADHPLAAGATVQLSDLAGLPFLAPRSSTSCAEMIQRACARAGFVSPAPPTSRSCSAWSPPSPSPSSAAEPAGPDLAIVRQFLLS